MYYKELMHLVDELYNSDKYLQVQHLVLLRYNKISQRASSHKFCDLAEELNCFELMDLDVGLQVNVRVSTVE